VRRWLAAAALVVIAGALLFGIVESRRTDTSLSARVGSSTCLSDTRNQLAAQSVQTASMVPCLTNLPDEWSVIEEHFERGRSRMVLTASTASGSRWTIELSGDCSPPAGVEPSTDDQVATYEQRKDDETGVERTHVSVFDGGCLTSTTSILRRYDHEYLLAEIDENFRLVPRSEIDAEVREHTDGQLGLDP
jgi:hypothetical protein